jgi:XRE family aerobic/anaerobic benzoate catabolism transcriptional regulator
MSDSIAVEPLREPAKLLCFQVGERVRALRREQKMTRRDLASATSISERYLGQLENGQANASLQILHRVASEFGMPISAILPLDATMSLDHQPLADLLGRLSTTEQEEAFRLLAKRFDNGKCELKGVALIGLRGAGKTTLGTQLSELTRAPFMRLSQVVADRVGLGMPEIMELWGPNAFRRLEREALAALIEEPGKVVLETSGGIVANEETFELLNQHFHTVWLKASPEEHMQRVIDQNDLRPIAGRKGAMNDLKAILNEREQVYNHADSALDTSGRNIRDCLAELVQVCKPMLCR